MLLTFMTVVEAGSVAFAVTGWKLQSRAAPMPERFLILPRKPRRGDA